MSENKKEIPRSQERSRRYPVLTPSFSPTTYAYSSDNGSLIQIDRGLGTITTIVAASTQGLAGGTAPTAGQAVTAVTDPLGRITSYTLDTQGRMTQLQTPDGALQTWALNTAGNPLLYIDQLGRRTANTFDGMENLTQTLHPDGTAVNFLYDSTFNKITQIQDELGNASNNLYDTDTGDLLTQADALGNVTTFTWSNGLKQTMAVVVRSPTLRPHIRRRVLHP